MNYTAQKICSAANQRAVLGLTISPRPDGTLTAPHRQQPRSHLALSSFGELEGGFSCYDETNKKNVKCAAVADLLLTW
jgi:hypothetical protein